MLFRKLIQNFGTWTSGHPNIDALIQETQLNATGFHDYIEWIPYNQFKDIKYLAEGGYAKVYSATWMQPEHWRNDAEAILRPLSEDIVSVALKCPRNQKEIEQLLNEIKVYVACSKHSNEYEKDNYYSNYSVIRCYGITYDSSQGYMMVTEYAKRGDLRRYLHQMRNYVEDNFLFETHQNFKWCDKLYILRDIAKGLATIHKAGLLHGDLHPGNVLQMEDNHVILGNVGNFYQSNTSIRLPKSRDTPKAFGIMPYMAPEVLQGKKYTKAADIYSFAMIMSEIASGVQPFAGRSHDAILALDICNGVRPHITSEIPKCFVKLLTSCWDNDPLKRPDTEEIFKTLNRWALGVDNTNWWHSSKSDQVSVQFLSADIAKKAKKELQPQNLTSDKSSEYQYDSKLQDLKIDHFLEM